MTTKFSAKPTPFKPPPICHEAPPFPEGDPDNWYDPPLWAWLNYQAESSGWYFTWRTRIRLLPGGPPGQWQGSASNGDYALQVNITIDPDQGTAAGQVDLLQYGTPQFQTVLPSRPLRTLEPILSQVLLLSQPSPPVTLNLIFAQ